MTYDRGEYEKDVKHTVMNSVVEGREKKTKCEFG